MEEKATNCLLTNDKARITALQPIRTVPVCPRRPATPHSGALVKPAISEDAPARLWSANLRISEAVPLIKMEIAMK